MTTAESLQLLCHNTFISLGQVMLRFLKKVPQSSGPGPPQSGMKRVWTALADPRRLVLPQTEATSPSVVHMSLVSRSFFLNLSLKSALLPG